MMRSKPMSRGALFDENGRRRFSTLKRSPMKRRRARRLDQRAHLDAEGAAIRAMPCVCCGRPGPCDAAHITLSRDQKGVGMKVSDRQRVPLRRACHRAWDQHAGKFRGLSDDRRYELGSRWVRAVRDALVPETTADGRAFEEIGLGRMTVDERGRDVWLPAGAES